MYWVTAWVLLVFNGSLTYSPPTKTLEDCKRMQKFITDETLAKSRCVEVTIQRKVPL
jgi:hypothetical protein